MPRDSTETPGSVSSARELAQRARYHATRIRDDEMEGKLRVLAEEMAAQAAAIEADGGGTIAVIREHDLTSLIARNRALLARAEVPRAYAVLLCSCCAR